MPIRKMGIWDRIRLFEIILGRKACWLWPGSHSNGYGTLYWAGRPALAHRIAFRLVRGPIPTGLEIDHLCRTRRCFNPWHLEPVTTRENTRRGKLASLFCKRGHRLDGANLLPGALKKGWRHCKACSDLKNRARPSRRRDHPPPP